MQPFKKLKKIKGSKRGITFSDKELFPIHSKFKYLIDHENQRVVIALSESEGQAVQEWKDQVQAITGNAELPTYEASVSRKASGNQYIPLVDIRNKEALSLFEGCTQLQVSIGDELIIVEGDQSTPSLWEKAKSFVQRKKKPIYVFDKQDVLNAVGLKVAETPGEQIKIASFFSGCGGMDQGFKEAGYDIVFALEKNPEAAATYRFNHGEHIHIGDICNHDTTLMQNAPLVIGGPPCQGFSSANRKTNFLNNPNNLLVRKYIDAILANQGCEVFVLENVPQILSAGNGQFVDEICTALADFDISYGVLSSADFGSAQDRKRAIFIGSKIGHIPLPKPTHTKEQYVTVRQAFEGLHDEIPNQLDYRGTANILT